LGGDVKAIVFGSRGSALALAQTKQVMAQLQKAWPGRTFELRVIKTQGDRLSEDESRPFGGTLAKGLFTGELERALRGGEIDLAVHSLKDLPTANAEGLTLAAIPLRADARDVLITRAARTLEELPAGSLLLTGSPRRAAQVRAVRRDLRTGPIRGNIDTRLRKFREQTEWTGLILAAAGLDRLRPNVRGLTVTPLPFTTMLPAPGQGALALQARADGADVLELSRAVHDATTGYAVAAERAFLHALGGGCQLPIAAYGEAGANRTLTLHGVAWLNNAQQQRFHFSGSVSGPIASARRIGQDLAQSFLERLET
jgi:hydroxymethylbilane synthase